MEAPLRARIVTLETLFSLGAFAPAAVQRDYRWEQRQCDALLGDLLRAFAASDLDPDAASADAVDPDEAASAGAEDPDEDGELWLAPPQTAPAAEAEMEPVYFLGSVMLAPTGGKGFEIYDGLQRLATLTVALACLRDWSAPVPAGIAALLHDPDSGAPRLTLALADHTLSHDVQRVGATRAMWRHAEGLSDSGLRLRAAIVLFRRAIRAMRQETRERFALFLRTRVMFTLIEVSGARLAYQAFVTTNDRGLALDRADVLKGQIVDLVGAGPGGAAEAEQVARCWTAERVAAGDRFEDLLRAVDFIERRVQQGPDALQHLFAHLEQAYGPAGTGDWARLRFREFSATFSKIWAHETLETARGVDAACRRLALLPFTEWTPLALLFLQRAKPARALRDMEGLARASVIVLLKGYSARDRAKIYGRAIRQLTERRNPFNGALRFDADAKRQARETLHGPLYEPETRAALVRWLELLCWEPDAPQRAVSRDCTIEHILPVRPPSESQWLDDFPDAEERAALTHTLGNLALLPKAENEALGNRPYDDKRMRFAELRPEFRLLDGLQSVPRWTPAAIRVRTEWLAARAIDELGLAP